MAGTEPRAQVQHRHDVDLQHRHLVLGVGLDHPPERGVAGVVDQDVDLDPQGGHPPEQLSARRTVREVGRYDVHRATTGPDLLGQGLELVGRARHEHQPVAAAGEVAGDLRPDAGGGPGDEAGAVRSRCRQAHAPHPRTPRCPARCGPACAAGRRQRSAGRGTSPGRRTGAPARRRAAPPQSRAELDLARERLRARHHDERLGESQPIQRDAAEVGGGVADVHPVPSLRSAPAPPQHRLRRHGRHRVPQARPQVLASGQTTRESRLPGGGAEPEVPHLVQRVDTSHPRRQGVRDEHPLHRDRRLQAQQRPPHSTTTTRTGASRTALSDVTNRRASSALPARRGCSPPAISRHSSRTASARAVIRSHRSSGRARWTASCATIATRPWSDRVAQPTAPTSRTGRRRTPERWARDPSPEVQVESVQTRSADLRADAVQEGERHGRLPRGQRGRGVEPACAPGQGTHGHQHQGEREEDRERAVRRRQHPPGRCEYRRRSQVHGCRQQQDRCHPSPGQAARSGVVARRPARRPGGQRASARGVERRRTSGRGACRHLGVRTHAAIVHPRIGRGTGAHRARRAPVRYRPARPGPVSGASCRASRAA